MTVLGPSCAKSVRSHRFGLGSGAGGIPLGGEGGVGDRDHIYIYIHTI